MLVWTVLECREDGGPQETEAAAGSKLADMEAELGTTLHSSLSPAEQKDLEALSPKLELLQVCVRACVCGPMLLCLALCSRQTARPNAQTVVALGREQN